MHSLTAVLFVAVACALLWLAFSVSGWLHVRHSWKKSVTWRDYRHFYNAVQRADEATIRDVARKYGAVIALLLALSVAAPLMAVPGMNVPRRAHNRHRNETIVLTERGIRAEAEYCVLLGRVELRNGILKLIPANKAMMATEIPRGKMTVITDEKLRHGQLFAHTTVVWKGGVAEATGATFFVHDEAAAELWSRRLEKYLWGGARYYNASNWARTRRQP